MRLPRVFVSTPLKSGDVIILNEPSSHRILRVLRLEVGSDLVVFNNTGMQHLAGISNTKKNSVTCVIKESFPKNSESILSIHLGQGISRGWKMDFTIQKAVELGASFVSPIFTEHCNVKLEGERLENKIRHWQEVAISASEQSGRCCVPEVLQAQNLESWCQGIVAQTDLRLVLTPDADTGLRDIFGSPSKVAILVGPEGGLSVSEMKLVARYDFREIKFGPRVLRTETAAIVAISALQSKWGDF